MSSFIDALVNAWNAPMINYSELMRQQDFVEEMQAAIVEGSEEKAARLADALEEFGFSTFINYDDSVTAVRKGAFVTDQDGKKSYITKSGGLLTLQEINDKNAVKTYEGLRLVDPDDTDDYNARFFAINARVEDEGGSNISFLRIIKNNPTRDLVFPRFDEAQAPGLTRSKFKQFIITQSNIGSSERMQIVETNKEYQVLFFGKKPEVLQIAGVLKNTIDNPWTVNMIFLWDEYMRGTKLVEEGNICQLFIDGELYEGYPFNFNRSKIAGQENITSFNFSFLIKTRTVVYNYERNTSGLD